MTSMPLSLNKLNMWLLMIAVFIGSVSKDMSSLQALVNWRCSGSVRVMVIGWWSDKNIGSTLALESNVRSF